MRRLLKPMYYYEKGGIIPREEEDSWLSVILWSDPTGVLFLPLLWFCFGLYIPICFCDLCQPLLLQSTLSDYIWFRCLMVGRNFHQHGKWVVASFNLVAVHETNYKHGFPLDTHLLKNVVVPNDQGPDGEQIIFISSRTDQTRTLFRHKVSDSGPLSQRPFHNR